MSPSMVVQNLHLGTSKTRFLDLDDLDLGINDLQVLRHHFAKHLYPKLNVQVPFRIESCQTFFFADPATGCWFTGTIIDASAERLKARNHRNEA